MYSETTQNIRVDVDPTYLPEESARAGQYIFTYRVRITNQGTAPVQLISRHWLITDGEGRIEQVKGPGVIGEQPVIEPGRTHEYSSYCPLPTPTGNMRGSYEMVDHQGNSFAAKIPLFFLRDMRALH